MGEKHHLNPHLVCLEQSGLLPPHALHVLRDLSRQLGCRRHADTVAWNDVLEHGVLRKQRQVAHPVIVVFHLRNMTEQRGGVVVVEVHSTKKSDCEQSCDRGTLWSQNIDERNGFIQMIR